MDSGTHANWRFLSGEWVDWDADVEKAEQLLLCDAQTSGGLLLASASPGALIAELDRRGTLAAIVGQVVTGQPGHIDVGP